MTRIQEDEKLNDDFDLTLDSFGDFEGLMGNQKESTIITDFVDYYIDNPSKECYKTFNGKYEKYKKLEEVLSPSKDEREAMVILGEEMGILIANEFDFEDEQIKGYKKEYIEFAREKLLAGTRKPYYRPMSMVYYIKALYGQTNIAFSLTGNNRKTNILLGNDYVTRLERYTDIRHLKAYVISLRAYRYIIDGDLFEMSAEERFAFVERDLIYATKWDEQNYLALYALALTYLNKSFKKYDVDKAMELFNRVKALENVPVGLDEYLSKEDKAKIMSLADNKIKSLK